MQNAIDRGVYIYRLYRIQADFSPRPEANPPSRRLKLVRFQENPTDHWGPLPKAKKQVGRFFYKYSNFTKVAKEVRIVVSSMADLRHSFLFVASWFDRVLVRLHCHWRNNSSHQLMFPD